MIYRAINPDDEGYLALAIAIICTKTTETAFEILSGAKRNKERRVNRRWTDDDMRQIDALRNAGEIWDSIGEMYGVNASSVHRQYNRWVKAERSSDGKVY